MERQEKIAGIPTRNEYSRDRARVIHSASFRRLQGKTQVLGLGDSDFYRTRLTHSIEVSQIAGGLIEKFQSESKTHDEYIPSTQLIEAISLAHDIGHPPFGHGGEIALNYCMRENGGFEGNAQTFRICTRLGEFSQINGLNLTRRTLLGILKYPATYSKCVNFNSYDNNNAPINISSFIPPKCIYDCDAEILEFAFLPFSELKDIFSEVKNLEKKHSRTFRKSLDTSIMELADDIAYGVHDLEDAVALGFVDKDSWYECFMKNTVVLEDSIYWENISENLFSRDGVRRKLAISKMVSRFIKACVIEEANDAEEPILRMNANIKNNKKEELDFLKKYIYENVINSTEVQMLEYRGQQMLIKIFEAIKGNPDRLLPEKHRRIYASIDETDLKMRVISDYISGTTDDYATKLYHRLFTPASGSVFEKL